MGKSKEKVFISQREILWHLVFIGFAINYMLRVNLNLAIVSMVRIKKTDTTISSECLESHNKTLAAEIGNSTLKPSQFYNVTESVRVVELINDDTTTAVPILNENDNLNGNTFLWDEHKQAKILGAFFWLHWLTQIPGGILAAKYGTKLVFGLSNFIAALCCFLIPAACYLGSTYVVLLRVFQGLVAGFAWPSMHNMAAKWIPPNERSKFVSAYLGSSVGAALTYPVCGYIIHLWGWEWVFYTSGIIGSAWYIAWYFLIYDSPAQHPRITENEKSYIINSLGTTVSHKKKSIPWKDILTSKYLWVILISQWGGIWGLFTLMIHGPTYFKTIHGWNIKATGVLSGLPHLVRVAWSYLFAQLGDYLLRNDKMSRTNVRKFAGFFATIAQGLGLLGLAYSGCNRIMAIVFLTASTGFNGSVSTGSLAALVDLSPNYASIMLGICNTAGACVGFLTPLVVAHFTYNNQTTVQWQKVFWIGAGQLIFVGVLYMAFLKSELQPWNSPPEENVKEESKKRTEEEKSELKPLNKNEESNV